VEEEERKMKDVEQREALTREEGSVVEHFCELGCDVN
jgi:hypothetical protein